MELIIKEKDLLIEKIINNFQSIKRKIATEGHFMTKDVSITMAQVTVLFLLQKNSEMNLTEISEVLGITKSAVTQLVEGLAKQKLIVRESDLCDRRIHHIKPSEKGTIYLETLRKKSFKKIFTIFEILNEQELKELEQITSKLTEHKKNNIDE